MLFLIDDRGKLYSVGLSGNGREIQYVDLVAPFDGSDTNLMVEQMAFYTDAIMFVARDLEGYKLFGHGKNGYYRMTHFKETSYDTSVPSEVFNVAKDLKEPKTTGGQITHIGCCYSFSVCVIDGTDVHVTGQNWMSNATNLDSGYHCWSNLLQRLKTKVVKMDCGDFHVVFLHEDGSVSVGGSNSSNQLTKYYNNSFGNTPIYTIPINILNCVDMYSGSNSVMYVTNKNQMYIAGKNFTSLNYDTSDNCLVKKLKLPTDEEQVLLEAKYSRDYATIRLENKPHIVYMLGSSYYGSKQYDLDEMDLRKIVPYSYSVGKCSEILFYRNLVQVIPMPTGYVIYCNNKAMDRNLFFDRLLLSTSLTENTKLLFDIVINH